MNFHIENTLKDLQSTTYLAHNIGNKRNRNYSTRQEIEQKVKKTDLLTFDGIYLNVWENRDILIGKRFILFVMGNYIGKDNSFNKKMPLERMCDRTHLSDLVAMGGKIGWHTWSHRNLTKLSYDEILKEVTPPSKMDYFAYPYGKFNKKVINAVQEAGFKYAFSVDKGDNSQYQLLRSYL